MSASPTQSQRPSLTLRSPADWRPRRAAHALPELRPGHLPGQPQQPGPLLGVRQPLLRRVRQGAARARGAALYRRKRVQAARVMRAPPGAARAGNLYPPPPGAAFWLGSTTAPAFSRVCSILLTNVQVPCEPGACTHVCGCLAAPCIHVLPAPGAYRLPRSCCAEALLGARGSRVATHPAFL